MKSLTITPLATLALLILSSGLRPLAAQSVRMGEPIRHKNVILIPLSYDGPASGHDYLTLQEGLKTGEVVITEKKGETNESFPSIIRRNNSTEPDQEQRRIPPASQVQQVEQVQQIQVGGGPRVNTLEIRNNSGRPLLLLAGEVIQGGKQNRVVEKDTIIPPGSEPVDLGVFCVEQNRWSREGDKEGGFTRSPDSLVQKELRSTVVKGDSQSAVWQKVESLNKKQGHESHTGDYSRNLTDEKRIKTVQSYSAALLRMLPEGSSGMIVFLNGRLMGADLLYSPALFASLRSRILNGYLQDVIDSGETTAGPAAPKRETEGLMKVIVNVTDHPAETEGDGAFRRLKQNSFEGSLLLVRENGRTLPLHLHLFPADRE